jgi:carboxymethylenebutenolidase
MKIEFPNGDATIRGHLETAAATGPAPAVVLIPDVRGLYAHFTEVAKRFADEGFTTLALDPYSREGTPDLPDMESVFSWLAALPDKRVIDDVRAAVAYLAGRTDVDASRIGVTGFCMGGQYALISACRVAGIAAAVSWYGMLRYDRTSETKPESALDAAPDLACPYLGFFGAEDELIPVADVDKLREILVGVRHETEVRVYDGAGHAFFNDTRPEMYRPEAAADSWRRAIEFFSRHLGR